MGEQPSQITRRDGFDAFESSDGKFVYYTKDDQPGIWREPSAGGDETRVIAKFPREFWGDWALSETGIYYINATSPHPTMDFFNFATHNAFVIVQLDSLPPSDDPGFSVSPDGKRILFSQVDASGVDIMLVENFH